MSYLHNYGLIRFSKKTGKIDTTLTSLGKGLIQMWALENTTKTKVCIIVDIDERIIISEYIGTDNGFPEIIKESDRFEYDIPDELYEEFKRNRAIQA